MKAIWKYSLGLVGTVQKVLMPLEARIVHVNDQRGRPTIWAEVDTDAKLVARYFYVFGTGQEFEEDCGVYVGTAVGNPYVWHVYEAPTEPSLNA